MYLYFDKKGVLLEIINDEALRQYNHQVNTMYVYTEIPIADIQHLSYWFELPDGTTTNALTTGTHHDKIVEEVIPPNSKRDLQKFQYGVKYTMYKIELPSGKPIFDEDGNETGRYEDNIFTQSGPVAVTIQVVYKDTTQKNLTLGKVVFIVEDEVVIPYERITVSQFEYLLSAVESVTKYDITDHIKDYNNPHKVTKEQVGLGNVDNTADLDKPISKATQEELDKKANTASLRLVATTGSYNDLDDKPRINSVTLQGDKSALDLRLVPIDLSPFEAVREPTKSFRQQADIFISHEGSGFRMALQSVKDMNTKIITSDSFAKVDFDKLDKGDFIYITR